ncbi:pyridoxal-phosphate dependent enzyme [Carnimonas bestiolae]|uniref:pyridoxal-phosphate dependent enzyme n=1 Tax=Carnimonas bestiolae TaxID=3402172 RepID=UPI003F4A8820
MPNTTAHRQGTGQELALQRQQAGNMQRNVVLIAGAGTGASLMGITLALQDAHLHVTTLLVEPDGCDMQSSLFSEHRIEGISVGVPAPFLDWALIDEVQHVQLQEVLDTQRWCYAQTGLLIGNSSAANLAVAKRVKAAKRFKNLPIVTVAYDSALWYDDFVAARGLQ